MKTGCTELFKSNNKVATKKLFSSRNTFGGNVMKTYKFKLIWEEDVWHSESINEDFDITLESDSFDTLVERLKIAVQDILEVDFNYDGDIQFVFQAERVDSLKSKAS